MSYNRNQMIIWYITIVDFNFVTLKAIQQKTLKAKNNNMQSWKDVILNTIRCNYTRHGCIIYVKLEAIAFVDDHNVF